MQTFAGLKDKIAFWRPRKPPLPFAVQFKKFQIILERNNQILELMADMGEKLGGEYVFDRQYIITACERLGDLVFKLISDISVLTQRKNVELFIAFETIQHQIQEELGGRHSFPNLRLTLPLESLNRDANEEAGNKMANLGEISNVLGLAVPDGFVVTTKAFFDFMNHNKLLKRVKEGVERLDGKSDAGLEELSRDIRRRILAGDVPRPVMAQINADLAALAARRDLRRALFAVRSSAWGEDSEFSFAGQYDSVLAVPAERIQEAYKQVLASAYSPAAWRYRLHRGYLEEEMAMAVGCQAMVDAAASGGLYTYVPLPREDEAIVVNAAWGLGVPVVDGTAETDTYILERDAPYAVRSAETACKENRLIAAAGGGTVLSPVEPPQRELPCLTPPQMEALAQAAMTIERYFKRPQDVEWSFDRRGDLFILQARPLNIRPRHSQVCRLPKEATRGVEVVFAGRGTIAHQGVAVGRVFVVRDDADLKRFPHGAILVTRYTSPRFSQLMGKAQGILTDVGSATGHMATLAREYRVPTVVNTGVATERLSTGDEVTLDATQNVVYRGAIQELCRFELTEQEVFEESREYRLLRRLLKRITALHLVDPHSENFKPAGCRTYHDITRWIHETAVEALIGLSESNWRGIEATPRRLVTDVPLGLMLIDIDGGLEAAEEEREVRPEMVRSAPLAALLKGMIDSGMWATEPVSVDLGSFMSSVTRTFSASGTAPQKMGRNLAVISREYVNLHLRLGYHFTIVDAYMCDRINDNYVYFRFLGGVTDFIRRSRRARCIAEILEKLDFRVEVHGDLVVARIKKLSLRRVREKMLVLGGLISYTRQLDVRLQNDEDLARHAEEFIQRIGPLLEV
jgi:pyruvate,water dikinase